MTKEQILNATGVTKTWKIQQLLMLGLTRREVADLVTNGNYGFVQNVFAKMMAGQIQAAASTPDTYLFPAFTRGFGVEIEAYNVPKRTLVAKLQAAGIAATAEAYNHTTRNHWKVVTDSSISGSQAFELVSPVLEGAAGLEELKTVCRVLKACGAYINKSCGLHIHFDASAMNLQAWKNVYINYAALEAEIDSFMPTSRRANNNGFCRSIVNSVDAVKQATTIEKVASAIGTRYVKVNPMSYLRHNTIEFRQHSGTIEFGKMANWIEFLHNLVAFSERFRVGEQASFDSLRKFCKPELVAYLHNRKQELAA